MNALPPGFSDTDFEALDAWLLRRAKGICEIVELEGFLTAVIIGPNTLSPLKWLPKVWGGTQPRFRDLEEMNRFTGLVMGFHNDIALAFQYAPEKFTPTFYESKIDGRRVRIVDEWCFGFMKGTRLDPAGWKPLKRERPNLLKPLQLFGTPAGWRELEAGGEVKMHRRWSPKITPAVREIYRFWIPHRRAMHEAHLAQARREDKPT
jgi:uncharacterized protein